MRLCDMGIKKRYITNDGQEFINSNNAIRHIRQQNNNEIKRRRQEWKNNKIIEQENILRKYFLELDNSNLNNFINNVIKNRFELKKILKGMKNIT